jgi:hypothetical protein
MRGRISSIRPSRNTDEDYFQPVIPSEVEGSQCADSAVTSRDSSTPLRFARNDQPHSHRAEAAVLTRLLYGRSEFVRAGNAVPLR